MEIARDTHLFPFCASLSIFFSGDYFRVSEPVPIAFVPRSYRLRGTCWCVTQGASPSARRAAPRRSASAKLRIPRALRAACCPVSRIPAYNGTDIANRGADNISREIDRSSHDTSGSHFMDTRSSTVVSTVPYRMRQKRRFQSNRTILEQFLFNSSSSLLSKLHAPVIIRYVFLQMPNILERKWRI